MRKPWFILLPDTPFKRYWNIILIFLLFYVAIPMPYYVSFHQPIPGQGMTSKDYIDILIDALFGIDIIVSFISAYDDDDTGIPMVDPKVISSKYLSSWFIFDLIAIIPFSLIE